MFCKNFGFVLSSDENGDFKTLDGVVLRILECVEY
jgi:hypothetical protein